MVSHGRLGWKFFNRYKLKALNLMIFLTIGFTIILLGFDFTMSTLNGYFSKEVSFLYPNYFITGKKDLDLSQSNTGFRDLGLPEETRTKIKAAISKDLHLYDGIFLFGSLYDKEHPSRSHSVIVVGIDFAAAREVFPVFATQFTQEQMMGMKADRKFIMDSKFSELSGFKEGETFVFLSDNYFRDVNGVKVTTSPPMKTPIYDTPNMWDIPLIYIDLDLLKKMAGMPDGFGWPLFAMGQKNQAVFGPGATISEWSLTKDLGLVSKDLTFYTPLTIRSGFTNTVNMLLTIFIGLGLILALIMIVSTSSNLFINFQNRKSDFGVMKAMGFQNKDFFLLIFFENLIIMTVSFVLSIILNFALSIAVPTVVVQDFQATFQIAPICIFFMAVLILIINLIAVQSPFRFVRSIDPLILMREE